MEHYIDKIVGEYSDAHEADLTKAITNIPASQPPTMTSEDADIPREVLKAINHQINHLEEEYTFWSRGRNSALWIYDEETGVYVENELRMDSSSTLYGLANSLFHLSQFHNGLRNLVASYQQSVLHDEARRREPSFGKMQHSLAYQQLTGFLGVSPIRVYDYLKEPDEDRFGALLSNSREYLFSLESRVRSSLLKEDPSAVNSALDDLEEHYKDLGTMCYHSIFYFRGLCQLKRARTRRRVYDALKCLFSSLFEQYRYQVRGFNPLATQAGNTLISRFSSDLRFLRIVGRGAIKALLSHTDRERRRGRAFDRAAYFRGNPIDVYLEYLEHPDVRDGVRVKAGKKPRVLTKIRQSLMYKNVKLARATDIIEKNERQLNEYLTRDKSHQTVSLFVHRFLILLQGISQ